MHCPGYEAHFSADPAQDSRPLALPEFPLTAVYAHLQAASAHAALLRRENAVSLPPAHIPQAAFEPAPPVRYSAHRHPYPAAVP